MTEVVLRHLASQRTVLSSDWIEENAAILTMGRQKNQASESDPTWRSAGIPLRPKPSGMTRILVIGDSFVWGDGYLNANDIWWRQLERELRHRGYWNVEVVAAGMNGASTQDQVRWLSDPSLMGSLDPDLILLGYVSNDPDMRDPDGRPLVRQIGRDVPLPTWRAIEATLGRVAPTVVAQIKPKLTAKWATRVEGAYHYDAWERQLLESENLAAYAEVVQSLGRAVRDLDLPFIVVTLPHSPSLAVFSARFQPVEPLFHAAGLSFHDTLERYVAEYGDTPDGFGSNLLKWGINPANAHPGPVTTRFYARTVADILERDVPQLMGRPTLTPPASRPAINDWMPPTATVTQIEPSTWTLLVPPSTAGLMPRMPLGEPHLMLAFELPVGIREVRLQGDTLRGAKLWWTSVDPLTGVDSHDPLGGQTRQGPDLSWNIEQKDPRHLVNTLRIAVDLAYPSPETSIDFVTTQVGRREGHAYVVDVADLVAEADDDANQTRSPWVLLEDGVPLALAHAGHAEIAERGGGRWSHWKTVVIFSTSDNSDPRKNGRRYELAKYADGEGALRLTIQFTENAARP